MYNFASNQILLYFTILFTLFVPGYFLLLAIFPKSKLFSALEKLIISVGLSIVSINFLVILFSKLGMQIERLSILFLILGFSAFCYAIYKARSKSITEDKSGETKKLFTFSQNQTVLIILILFLTIFIKTIYLGQTIFPTSTDLGHHMYWSKVISETGELPVYAKQNIIEIDENYQISDPERVPDFIIGEHIVFALVGILTGASFISAFPSLILFLINIFSILAIFILALRFFQTYSFGKNAAIFSLLLIGPLYAISSPQAKFVSGGVIGNLIGNLFLPLIFYFYYRALKEKNSLLLSVALFFTTGLFYTHHLSSFIFLYAFFFSLIFFVAFNLKNIKKHLKDWWKLIASPSVIIVLVSIGLFLLFVHLPSYLDKSAVSSAVGTPTKSTRVGVGIPNLKFTAGEARFALGIFGLLILAILKRRRYYSSAFVLGWSIALFVMSLWPQYLFVNIISSRIANYISYPLSIAGGFALAWIFYQVSQSKKGTLTSKFGFSIFTLILAFVMFSGMYDNSMSLKENPNFGKAIQTFHASDYLSKKVSPGDTVLKDHIYLTSDAWIKLFFMRDYNYPFSRGFLKRYEDPLKKREMCTLWMISTPNTENGKKCFSDTGINFVVVNPELDSSQFQKSDDFWQVYLSDEISVFYRK